MRKLLLISLIISILQTSLFETNAQTYPRPEINLDEFMQELFPIQDDDLNYEEIYETLLQLYRNPIDLNTAQREDLMSMFLLTELQINQLLNYRLKFGKLLTIYELQAVPSFDLTTIYKILPFVEVKESGLNVGSQPLLKRILNEHESHYFLLRFDRTLETRQGYTNRASVNQKYLGSPNRLYVRYRVSHPKDFSLGFTLEKDAGEQLIWDTKTRRYGADFISFHAHFQNKGRFKSIILGDYQLQIGQGLLLSSGLTIGKGAETVQTIRRPTLGIRPFTSAIEAGFFRGGAFTYSLGKFELTGFYSNTRRDGSISEIDNDTTIVELIDNEQFVETLRISGFHRTQSEVLGKGIFREHTWGGHLGFKNLKNNLLLGLSFIQNNYNLPFQRSYRSQKDFILYQFEFQGDKNYNLGFHFTYHWQNFSFFGEAAQSKSGGKGIIGGFVASLAPNVEMAMLYRNYDRNFHTFFGSALSEGTRNINEKGFYWGLKISPLPKIKWAAYFDKFSFPWMRYRVDTPSEGHEWFSRLTYQISKKISLYAQFREEIKGRNLPSDTQSGNFKLIGQGKKHNFMLNTDYQAIKFLTLRSRIQWSSFELGGRKTQGFAIVQDFGFDWGKLGFDMRFALFDTDDYDNRQYVFEKNVLWFFAIPAYYGRGLRNYVLLKYQLAEKWDIWLRLSRFTYQNQTTISTGSEQIKGNTRTDLTVQLRIKI